MKGFLLRAQPALVRTIKSLLMILFVAYPVSIMVPFSIAIWFPKIPESVATALQARTFSFILLALLGLEWLVLFTVSFLVWTKFPALVATIGLAAVATMLMTNSGYSWYLAALLQTAIAATSFWTFFTLNGWVERGLGCGQSWACFLEKIRQVGLLAVLFGDAAMTASAVNASVLLWKCGLIPGPRGLAGWLTWLLNELGQLGRTLLWGDPEFLGLLVFLPIAVLVSGCIVRRRPTRLPAWFVALLFVATFLFWLAWSRPNPFILEQEASSGRAALAALEIACALKDPSNVALLPTGAKPIFWYSVYLAGAATIITLILLAFPWRSTGSREAVCARHRKCAP